MNARHRRLLVLGLVLALGAYSFALARSRPTRPGPAPERVEELSDTAVQVPTPGGSDACPAEFDDAEFFIEINATDGDAGVQLKLDGDGWNELEMTDPLGKRHPRGGCVRRTRR